MRAALALALLATPAAADPTAGLVPLGDRLFLIPGHPPSDGSGLGMLFIPGLPSVSSITASDPLLEPLRMEGPIVSATGMTPGPVFAEYAVPDGYADHVGLPDQLRAPGWDVRWGAGAEGGAFLSAVPDGTDPDLLLTCTAAGPADLVLDRCLLSLTYPPDPQIVVMASITRPTAPAELIQSLPALSDRLREIALCLDVTEARPADPEAALAAPLRENPRLEGCGDGLGS